MKRNKKQEAINKVKLNVILSFVRVGLNEIAKIENPTKKVTQQQAKVERWLEEAWNDVNLQSFGARHRKEADKRVSCVEKTVEDTLARSGLKTGVELFASLWVMISFILDDICLEAKKKGRCWFYLKTTVATWTAMLLKLSSPLAEETGCKMALEVWDTLVK